LAALTDVPPDFVDADFSIPPPELSPDRRLSSTDGYEVVRADYAIAFPVDLVNNYSTESIMEILMAVTPANMTERLRVAFESFGGRYGLNVTGIQAPKLVIYTADGTTVIELSVSSATVARPWSDLFAFITVCFLFYVSK